MTPGAGPPASVTPLHLRAVAAGAADLAADNAYSSVLVGDVDTAAVYTVYAIGMRNGQPPLQALLAVESIDGMPVPTG